MHESAETIEKVQLVNAGIIDIDKNQLLIGLRILPKGQILGFSEGSLFSFGFRVLKRFQYTTHLF